MNIPDVTPIVNEAEDIPCQEPASTPAPVVLDQSILTQFLAAVTTKIQEVVEPLMDRLDQLEQRQIEIAPSAGDYTLGPGVPREYNNHDPALAGMRFARRVTLRTAPVEDNPEQYEHPVAAPAFSKGVD